jgi:hypothetical protein
VEYLDDKIRKIPRTCQFLEKIKEKEGKLIKSIEELRRIRKINEKFSILRIVSELISTIAPF